jgi:hypothetical protein
MKYFVAKFKCPCPSCQCIFTVCIHAEGPLDPSEQVPFRCPNDSMLLRIPASVLRQADSCHCPATAGATRTSESAPAATSGNERVSKGGKGSWWKFWG